MKNNGQKLNNGFVLSVIAILCCILWGSAFPMIKIGYDCFNIDKRDTATIILFAGIRFFLAGVLTIVVFSTFSKKMLIPRRKSIGKIGILSAFQTVLQYLFFYLGLAYSTGVKSSVINGTSVFISLFVSVIIFRQERFTVPKIIGAILGFSGVFVAGYFGSAGGEGFQIGDLFILLSAVSYSFSLVLMRRFSAEENPTVLSGYQFVFGGLIMAVVGFIFGGRINFDDVKGIVVLLYLAFLSAIAYSLWSLLLKYNPVSRISVYNSFTPIFGFILSYILLGEDNGSLMLNIIGLFLVVAGMLFLNLNYKKRPQV